MSVVAALAVYVAADAGPVVRAVAALAAYAAAGVGPDVRAAAALAAIVAAGVALAVLFLRLRPFSHVLFVRMQEC